MKIHLVYPDIASFHGLPYHPGLASIAAVLKERGHDVSLSYIQSTEKMKSVLAEIVSSKPDIVGFTSVETQFRHVRELASLIKKKHECFVVCGGPFVSLFPEIILSQPFIDAAIIGEGEMAFAGLAERLAKKASWHDLPNLAYKDPATGSIVKNALAPVIKDLDKLPYPATELFPYQDIIDRENIAMFHFNRGCPYLCAFCSNESLGKLYGMGSNRIRMRSVASVLDEIGSTISKYKLRDDTVLHFTDDLFVFDKKWTEDFCFQYKKRFGRPFWCTGRSNYINDDVCRALKRAGCVTLMMSVESGNDHIRNAVMNRNISRETLFKSFETCHKHGIGTLATCIIGFPTETPAMIEDSIRTVAQLKSITTYGINLFYPYKGTRLRTYCEEKGYLKSDIGEEFVERKDSALALPDLPQEKLLYYYNNWIPLIMRHKGIKYRVKYAVWGTWNRCRSTKAGEAMRSVLNGTKAGKAFKKMMMKLLWNR
jgi:anaerobic magnesium-protoporphyrin IX monomethyl ester cyclase